MPLPSPGIAADDADGAQPTATKKAVFFHGLKKVLRAGRSKAAARTWTTNEVYDGRNEALITTDKNADEPFHGAGGTGFDKSP